MPEHITFLLRIEEYLYLKFTGFGISIHSYEIIVYGA